MEFVVQQRLAHDAPLKYEGIETQTDGYTTAKSPKDMFNLLEIDNDLKMVDGAIREYWGLNTEK